MAPASGPIASTSALRFPTAMNSEPNEVTMKNQLEMGTSAATAPATARRTKPEARATTSTTTMCFSTAEYDVVRTM